MRSTLIHGGATLAALLLGLGCAPRAQGPGDAVRQYAEAVERQDYRAAYRMMSARYRSQHSEDDFVRSLGDRPRTTKAAAARLRNSSEDAELSASFVYGLGDELQLHREEGQWRIASNPLAFYDQSTPRNALRSLIRAYRLRRWDVMLQLQPEAYSSASSAAEIEKQFTGSRAQDIAELFDRLEANLRTEIDELGDRARMVYPVDDELAEVRFLREDARWKIEDIR